MLKIISPNCYTVHIAYIITWDSVSGKTLNSHVLKNKMVAEHCANDCPCDTNTVQPLRFVTLKTQPFPQCNNQCIDHWLSKDANQLNT
jgi:hypothetical protein